MNTKTKISLGLAGVGAALVLRHKRRRSRERDLMGKIVLITGGSRGLGLALARRFAAEGCRVAICARDGGELNRAKEDLIREGARVTSVVCDVTDPADVERMIEAVTIHFGHIDILVNNAGQIQVGPLESLTLDDFEKAMDVMFWGTVYPSLSVLPAFLERNEGQIVNITSIGGKVAVPHLLAYSCAKNAAVGFSEGLHTELFRTGIKVTTVVPGLMRTGSYNAAVFKGDQQAESKWFSLCASLPGITVSAARAADSIVRAVKRGDAEKIVGLPANLLVRANGIAPGLTQEALGFAGRWLLPDGKRPASQSKHGRPGWSIPRLSDTGMRALLFLGRSAARQLNQRVA